ncbi:hypothetical protein PROFUN_09010 [Planoprotostelium fungivorum]|uniref:Uncharacterized protein n=1 Tax=Planoprotostelium fungivorum TaxID=1890364 RepID=A0A2P6MV05_9EUKA|nr:hypothetical protein PROFUN_09010 [Planoprotostelium fungivorum]
MRRRDEGKIREKEIVTGLFSLGAPLHKAFNIIDLMILEDIFTSMPLPKHHPFLFSPTISISFVTCLTSIRAVIQPASHRLKLQKPRRKLTSCVNSHPASVPSASGRGCCRDFCSTPYTLQLTKRQQHEASSFHDPRAGETKNTHHEHTLRTRLRMTISITNTPTDDGDHAEDISSCHGPNRQVDNLLRILLRILRSDKPSGQITMVTDAKEIVKNPHYALFQELLTQLLPEIRLSDFGPSFEERLVFLINLHNLCITHQSIMNKTRSTIFSCSVQKYNVGGFTITTGLLEGAVRGTIQDDVKHPFLAALGWTPFYLKREPLRHLTLFRPDGDSCPLDIIDLEQLPSQLQQMKKLHMSRVSMDSTRHRIMVPSGLQEYLSEMQALQRDVDIRMILNKDLNSCGFTLKSMITGDYKVVLVRNKRSDFCIPMSPQLDGSA